MLRKSLVTAAVLAIALAGVGTDAFAKSCKDPKTGKFIKCPTAAAPASNHCRDTKTKKFVKCGAPGSEPVPAK